ncbi:MAG: acyl-CoA desaturase, partial [bacterium]|nr:acyl-CoA desaturase [bacterium]
MIHFAETNRDDFYFVLRARVKNHFQLNNLSPFGGVELILKTLLLLSFLFIPYGLILTGYYSLLTMLGLAALMGAANAAIGMAVMHDANHGAYSSNDTLTKVVAFFIYVLTIGGNPTSWKIQHNILHHRYTNIYGTDEDLEPYGTMRFTPNAHYKSFYRYQHVYSFLMYCLLTFVWVLHKEFIQLYRYRKIKLIKTNWAFYKSIAILILAKTLYFFYILIIPMLVLNITWLQWFIAFFLYHLVSGFIIALVFQMAHIVSNAQFPQLNLEGNIDNQWAIHQIQTTTNFAPNSYLLFWFIGGLNYQIEHHLFPGISHIHYKN